MFEVPEGLKRRLAAILASDIAGCSRLVGRKTKTRRFANSNDRLWTQKRALCCSTRNVVKGSI